MQQAIHWTAIDPARPDALNIGDRVAFEAGGAPIFTVVKLEPGCAWVSDHGDLVARPLSALRWKAGQD
ncbi:hypothetical protein [Phenylobacterium immobile]|uniref:hypothetical protein n=1 Tax=Phenylobacterium immobile TaxID=21 RepID=UPI000AB11D9B|nr:hypothetical protein [Phenylobacterium immobile]